MSSMFREKNKPSGAAFFPWYSKRCARPCDIVECADGTWGVRIAGEYRGSVARTPSGKFTARNFNAPQRQRAKTFATFLRAIRYASYP